MKMKHQASIGPDSYNCLYFSQIAGVMFQVLYYQDNYTVAPEDSHYVRASSQLLKI